MRQADGIPNVVAGRVENRRVAALLPQCQGTTSEAARLKNCVVEEATRPTDLQRKQHMIHESN